jgi:preprotein translocase subunit SecG
VRVLIAGDHPLFMGGEPPSPLWAEGSRYPEAVFDVILPVVQVLLSAILIVLVLMHSGRDTGFGGMGFTPASQGGQHIVERNLTRLTLVVAALFGINTVALFYVL